MERFCLLRCSCPAWILVVLLCHTSWAQPAVVNKGRRLFADQKYLEAKKIFGDIPDASGEFGAARYYLGRIALIEQDFEEAAEKLEEAVESNSNNADYHYWLGVVYGQQAFNANVIKQ